MKNFVIKNEVIKYPGAGGWHFVEMSKKQSDELRKLSNLKKVGWGYIKVKATIGRTSWDTTLFPTKKEGPCLLAIKADVRKKEGVIAGKKIAVKISVV
jgi:hypothetical protein